MKDCDFEKNANAEVLFDVGIIKAFPRLTLERHIRIKVFTDRGTHKGEFRIRVQNDGSGNPITDLQAETFNLEDGKVQTTAFDKKTLYFSKVDQPDQRGLVCGAEYKTGLGIRDTLCKYTAALCLVFSGQYPYPFQPTGDGLLGTRQRQDDASHVRQSFAVDNKLSDNDKQIRVMVNVHSLPDEIYMTSAKDNLERIEIYPDLLMGHTWDLIGRALLNYEHFGSEFEQSLAGEGAIIKHAKSLPSDDQKIAFLFDTVRNAMKWDGMTNFFAYDAITKAWNKRSGNSAEINLILFNLLRRAGINAQPIVVSTRNNGKMTPAFPNFLGFNNMVVYIPVDTSKFYILDASDKNNMNNTIPAIRN